MSSVDQDVDLTGLARAEAPLTPPRRNLLRVLVPLALLAAFAFILRDAIRELLTERVPVTLTRPIRLEGQGPTAAPRTLLAQAAGWVEPDPFPIHAPALAAGVVREVLVQESDAVKTGDPLALLISDDAQIRCDKARALVEVSQAEVELASAELRIAEASFRAAIEVTAAHEAAKAALTGAQAAADHAAATTREGIAKVSLAESEVEVQRALESAGTSGPRQVEIAEADLEVAKARLAALQGDVALAGAAVGEAQAEVKRTRDHLELRFEETRVVDTNRARLARAKGQLAESLAALAVADLELERMVVRAPMGGIVLERLAVAGDDLDAGAALCSIYEPASLRVRVDVPQSDVEALAVGQEAEIMADSRPGRPYAGEVLRIVQLADIQKVTLEVQVRVMDADDLLRPDMLAQIRFYSSPQPLEPAEGGSTHRAAIRIAVPRELVRDGAVWVHDPDGDRAVRRKVKTGAITAGADGAQLIEVTEGLDWTVELIDGGRDRLPISDADGGIAVVVQTPIAQDPNGGQQ